MKVFISYRRDDSIIHSRLIHNELAARFGQGDVFMDIDDIDYGEDFARKINDRLDAADVVVAVIGPQWADILQRRAHGDDYVRHELARSLAMGKRIVPVLIGQAAPPGAGLPPDLAGLRLLNCLRMEERSLKAHINELLEAIRGGSFEDELRERNRLRLARWAGAALGLAMFFAAWLALLDFVGLDTRFASATMWLAQPGTTAPWSGEVMLVAIDEKSQEAMGRPFDASWRREHAQLIERLSKAGARSIAFDVFIEREGKPEDDDALETAISTAKATPVIFAVKRMEGNHPALLPRIAKVAAGGIACGGMKFDYARSMPLAVQRGQLLFPSLALGAFNGGGKVESLSEADRELRVRVVQDDRSPDVGFSSAETRRTVEAGCEAIQRGDRIALQWFDPALLPQLRSPDRRVPYEQVLQAANDSDLAMFKGKIVLVGLTLAGRDVFTVPRAGDRWGAELHVEQVDALVRGDVIRPMGFAASVVLMLGLGLAGASLRHALGRRVWWARVIAASGGIVACAALAVVIYRIDHVLVNLPYAVAAFMLSWWLAARLERRDGR
jgi:CHASE2 domain-containing sensor protein